MLMVEGGNLTQPIHPSGNLSHHQNRPEIPNLFRYKVKVKPIHPAHACSTATATWAPSLVMAGQPGMGNRGGSSCMSFVPPCVFHVPFFFQQNSCLSSSVQLSQINSGPTLRPLTAVRLLSSLLFLDLANLNSTALVLGLLNIFKQYQVGHGVTGIMVSFSKPSLILGLYGHILRLFQRHWVGRVRPPQPSPLHLTQSNQ